GAGTAGGTHPAPQRPSGGRTAARNTRPRAGRSSAPEPGAAVAAAGGCTGQGAGGGPCAARPPSRRPQGAAAGREVRGDRPSPRAGAGGCPPRPGSAAPRGGAGRGGGRKPPSAISGAAPVPPQGRLGRREQRLRRCAPGAERGTTPSPPARRGRGVLL